MTIVIVLLLFLTVVDFGRMAAMHTAAVTASREAARYGSAVGPVAGTERYRNCDGIRDAARTVTASLISLTHDDIAVSYDDGPGTAAHTSCPTTAGADTVVAGAVTTLDRVVVRVTFTSDLVPMPTPTWPAGWSPSDAADAVMLASYQALAIASGTNFTNKVTEITKNGAYYTSSTEGMDIGSVVPSVVDVVLVAPNGEIKISASSTTFNAYQDPGLPRQGILMLAGKTFPGTERCDKYAISVSGSTTIWNGILWALVAWSRCPGRATPPSTGRSSGGPFA